MISERENLEILPVEKVVSSPSSGYRNVLALSMFLFLGALTALSLWGQSPPGAIPASAPPAEFSSGRAMKHVEAVAQKPRPIGSTENEAARAYIKNELIAQGLNPEVQETMAVAEDIVYINQLGTVRNVLARLKGEANTKAVLLATHYDSVPTSPGANDNGSGVATLLETLRALKSGPSLKNDVIFLFTDGREAGELGARAFMSHPWINDVGVVLNFDSRGTGGTVFMFETTQSHTNWLVSNLAKAVQYPAASSYIYRAYKTLAPGPTNLTVFRKRDLEGLNLANINGRTFFHTRQDNIQNLDERSLQHKGYYALGLTREFGNQDLNNLTNLSAEKLGNIVYFDLLGMTIVRYPSKLATPLGVFIVLLFIGLVVIGLKKKYLTMGGLLLGFVSFLSALVGVFLTVTFSKRMIKAVSHSPNDDVLTFLGYVMLTVTVVSAVYYWYSRRVSAPNFAVGGLLCWAILLALALITFPDDSYLFAWPLLFSLIPLGYQYLSGKSADSKGYTILICACAAPGIVLLIPLIHSLYVGIGLTLPELLMILLTLVGGLLIPHLSILAKAIPANLAFISTGGALAVILLVVGLLSGSYSVRHPRPDSLFYGLNADTGKAVWASTDSAPDKWTSQYLSAESEINDKAEFFLLGSRYFLNGPATSMQLPPPNVVKSSEIESNGVRILELQVGSPRQALVMEVVTENDTPIVFAKVNGRGVALEKDRLYLRYLGLPQDGISLTLGVEAAKPLHLRVGDYSYGIAGGSGINYKERPEGFMATSSEVWKQDSVAVSKDYTF